MTILISPSIHQSNSWTHPALERQSWLRKHPFAGFCMVINYILVGSYKKFQPILLSYFGENAFFVFFHWFSLGPTGIKGARNQMLPWKAPNDPKTLPMGILHEYMPCWTTLGPFRYPRGSQNGPKEHQNGLNGSKSPEWLKMSLHDSKWP